jgi:hypothetical protein
MNSTKETTNPIDTLRAIDPTVMVGTALATCTGYTVRYYDGTTATLYGAERYVPPTGGPYLPPGPGDEYSRIEITVAALPMCDGDLGLAVFPTSAVQDVRRHTWFHSDLFGGY